MSIGERPFIDILHDRRFKRSLVIRNSNLSDKDLRSERERFIKLNFPAVYPYPEFDSLPPVRLDDPTWIIERRAARDLQPDFIDICLGYFPQKQRPTYIFIYDETRKGLLSAMISIDLFGSENSIKSRGVHYKFIHNNCIQIEFHSIMTLCTRMYEEGYRPILKKDRLIFIFKSKPVLLLLDFVYTRIPLTPHWYLNSQSYLESRQEAIKTGFGLRGEKLEWFRKYDQVLRKAGMDEIKGVPPIPDDC